MVPKRRFLRDYHQRRTKDEALFGGAGPRMSSERAGDLLPMHSHPASVVYSLSVGKATAEAASSYHRARSACTMDQADVGKQQGAIRAANLLAFAITESRII